MSNNPLPADEQEAGRASVSGAFNGAASTFREKAEEYIGGANINGVKDSVKGLADAASERMNATADYLRNTGATRMRSDVEEMIKANPGPALLVAATLGFIVGRTLSRD